MVNLQRKDCSSPGCKLSANYGFEKAKTYCRAHAQRGMSDPRGVVVGPSTEATQLVEPILPRAVASPADRGMPRVEASSVAPVVRAAAAAYATGRSCDGGSVGEQELGPPSGGTSEGEGGEEGVAHGGSVGEQETEPVTELPASSGGTFEGEGGEEGVAHEGSMGEQEPGPVAELPVNPSGRTPEGHGGGEEVALAATAVQQGERDNGTATVGDAEVETGLDLLAIACDGARRVDVATPVADATESLVLYDHFLGR